MAEDPRRADAREIDEMARRAPKSEWQEKSAPAAGDPVSDDEKRGLNVIAQSDPRGDGSIAGVSDPNRGDVGATPPAEDRTLGGGLRKNPPLVEDVASEDGGISMSGGAAGGA
jgi:hypothetical protein